MSALPSVLVTQSYLTLCDLMDCNLSDSSACGILQARMLEWVAMPCSRASSWPRGQTWISCIAGRFFTIWTTREAVFTILVKWLMIKTCSTPKNPTDGGSPWLKMEGNAEDAGPSLPLILWHSAGSRNPRWVGSWRLGLRCGQCGMSRTGSCSEAVNAEQHKGGADGNPMIPYKRFPTWVQGLLQDVVFLVLPWAREQKPDLLTHFARANLKKF